MENIIFSHIRKNKKTIAIAFFTVFLQQIFSLLDPQIFRIMVDNYITKFNAMPLHMFMYGTLGLLVLSMVVALVARVSKHMQNYYISVVSQNIGAGLYAQSVGHTLSL